VAREKATVAGVLPMPFQFLAAWVGVWVARHQADRVEYLKTVNRALMERLGKKRLRFTDAERRQLAVLGKKLGRKALAEVATIATPDTIFALVPGARGQEVRRQHSSGARAAADGGRNSTASRGDGDAEHELGATPGCGAHSRTSGTRSVGTQSRGS
jgi:hypothetical protein